MNDLLPSLHLLATFVVASAILAVTPGPGVLYIVTRSLTQGRTSGYASVAGVALGNLCNAIGASLGLAALFDLSSAAFTMVKFAGALYLIHLGVQSLRATSDHIESKPPRNARVGRVFRDGFLVALLNPKTALFFAAFLPQFMTPETAGMAQSIVLGALFVAIAAVTDTLYAWSAGCLGSTLGRTRGARRLGRYLSGGTFIGLGTFTALTSASR